MNALSVDELIRDLLLLKIDVVFRFMCLTKHVIYLNSDYITHYIQARTVDWDQPLRTSQSRKKLSFSLRLFYVNIVIEP